MSTLTGLTTEAALHTYLQSQSPDPHPTTITLLTGGTANYVYRATFPNGTTKVYKHAAPYLHSNTAFALDPTRLHYEAWAYATLPPILGRELPQSQVHPPTLYSSDLKENLLCISDGGHQNLKDAYKSLSEAEVRRIGEELGVWLAGLHSCTTAVSMSMSETVTDQVDLTANNPVAKIYRHSYQNLASALREYDCGERDIKLAESVDAEFGQMLEDGIDGVERAECVCHGDFWPGNVLLKKADGGESEVEGRHAKEASWNMTIVDWEMVRRGGSATDVGQFAAEAFLLDRFRGNKGLLPAFLMSYIHARRSREDSGLQTLGADWMRCMAVHGAVHIAFWPTRVEWTDREGTKALVEIGLDMIRKAFMRDWEGMKRCELPLFIDECCH